MVRRKRLQTSSQDEERKTPSSPTVQRLAFKRLLYALMVSHPSHADHQWSFNSTIAASDNSDANGRVWWRVPRLASELEGWNRGYVSLNPGEFRLQAPDGSGDIIRDAPVPDHPRLLSDLLNEQLRILQVQASPQDQELLLLKKRGENLVEDMKTGTFAKGFDLFRNETLKLRAGETSAQQAVDDLLANCLLGFRLPGTLYAMAMALLQIQMGAKIWIEEDIYTDVRSFLRFLLDESVKSHPAVLEAAVKIGNGHFAQGQKGLQSALSSLTLEKFYRQLYFAAYHSWAACAIAKDAYEQLPAGQLNYTELVAEESFACIMTGLWDDLENVVEGDTYDFEDTLTDYLKDDPLNGDRDAERFLKDLTRPTNPILPKHYAHVSLARAMIRAGGKWLQEGLEKLRSLEAEFHSRDSLLEDSRLELNNIESGLMLGYRKLGDEERTRRYAVKIAGRAIVERS